MKTPKHRGLQTRLFPWIFLLRVGVKRISLRVHAKRRHERAAGFRFFVIFVLFFARLRPLYAAFVLCFAKPSIPTVLRNNSCRFFLSCLSRRRLFCVFWCLMAFCGIFLQCAVHLPIPCRNRFPQFFRFRTQKARRLNRRAGNRPFYRERSSTNSSRTAFGSGLLSRALKNFSATCGNSA